MSEIFSRTIRAAQIRDAAQSFEVTADAAQRAGLAALFDLPEIAALQGVFALQHQQGGVIAATLHLTAAVTQICVVTLEPFKVRLDEQVALRFVPAASLKETADIGEVDAATLEGPDEIPYAGGIIDLGAALAEQLALSLDPYPRKPGAMLPDADDEPAGHPFAGLGNLRRAD